MGIALVVLVAGSIVAAVSVRGTAFVSPIAPGTPTSTPAGIAAPVTWIDPAGFSIQYPGDIAIDKHPEDVQNYAHLEFTHPSHPGGLIVWAKDLPKGDIGTWLAAQKQLSGAAIVDTTLAGVGVKKIRSADGTLLMTAGFVDDMLVVIETKLTDAAYWTQIHEEISNSFALKEPPQATETDTGTAAGAADEEEILE